MKNKQQVLKRLMCLWWKHGSYLKEMFEDRHAEPQARLEVLLEFLLRNIPA